MYGNCQKNDQLSPLGGRWMEAKLRRTVDTTPASDRIPGERSAKHTQAAILNANINIVSHRPDLI
jgi:hypothetical protein